MGAPAVVMGDSIQGICATHLLIGPLGVPIPAPPMPFSAMIATGVVATVLIGGKPAAVVGAGGFNVPPHVGLHPTDPFMAPPLQQGMTTMGSATVLIGGLPALRMGDTGMCCPPNVGTVMGSAATVLIGG